MAATAGRRSTTYLCECPFVLGDLFIFQAGGFTILDLDLLLLLGVRRTCILLTRVDATFSFLVALQPSLKNRLDQMVCSDKVACFRVLAHPVCEFVDVATGFEDILRSRIVQS